MSNPPKGVADHPAKEEMEKIWRSGGKAKDIVEYLEENGLPVIAQRTIARYGQRYWSEKITLSTEVTSPDQLGDFVSSVESAQLGKIAKISFSKKKYPGWEKIDGQNIQVEKESIAQTIDIVPTTEATEPVYTLDRAQLAPINVKHKKKDKEKPTGWDLGFVIPDPQIGFHRDVDGNFTTTHDEAAIDVMHQIQLDYETDHGIDLIVMLGDNMDFSAFSTHRSAPGYVVNTQLEIDRLGTEVAVQRTIAQDAEIIAFNGNHDDRMNKQIIDKIPGLHGIAKANTREPVLSVANLCRFDEYNITSIDTYPDGEYWANDYLRFEHGSLVSSTPGATAAKYLNGSRVSTVYGHIHRHELVFSRILGRNSNRTIFAGSPGCLSRRDGVLPSSTTGISPKGKQAGLKGEKWHHAVWVIWFERGGEQRAIPVPIMIEDGMAIHNGRIYTSNVTPNGEKI